MLGTSRHDSAPLAQSQHDLLPIEPQAAPDADSGQLALARERVDRAALEAQPFGHLVGCQQLVGH
jgi:hypothetical protein